MYKNVIIKNLNPSQYQTPETKVNKKIQPVKKGQSANIEVEEGEQVITDLNNDGYPENYTAAGLPHSQGGTKLNLPDDSFIFSKDRSMKIKDELIQQMFGKTPKKSGITPAEIAKKYDINKYRQILADPDSDKLQRDTAELMIANYNEKLGKLALVQESMKNFPDGIPHIAMPYITTNSFDPATLYSTQGDEGSAETEQMQFGGDKKFYRMSDTGSTTSRNNVKDILTSFINSDNKYSPEFKNVVIKRIANNLIKKPVDTTGATAAGNYSTHDYNFKFGGSMVGDQPGADLFEQIGLLLNYAQFGGGMNQNTADHFGGVGMVMNYAQDGKNHKTVKIKRTPDGIPAYDPEEKMFLQTLSPDVVLPEDTVENKQPSKNGVYGRFDPKSADKNWAWYGKKINWDKPEEVGAAQKAYNDRLYKKMKDAGYSDKTANLAVKRVGFVDQKGVPNALDQQAGKYTETRTDFQIPNKKQTETPALIQNKEADLSAVHANHFTNTPGKNESAPFWTQDVINGMGAFGDMNRIKKYMPWVAPVNLGTMTPTFYDPTRELAANAEQANISSQAAAMFAGPQGLNARLSEIQGRGAENAANILGKYNNLNVDTANKFEQGNTAIKNENAMIQADNANNLYKDTVMANQNFDNSKAQARANFRTALTTALTNRGQTQSLNATQDQYKVDPITGYTYLANPKKSLTNYGNTNTAEDQVMARIKKYKDAGYSDDLISRIMGIK